LVCLSFFSSIFLRLITERFPSVCVCLYLLRDNEEIGSVSHQGAESNFLEAILTRVSSSFTNQPSPALTEQTLAASFLLSCDMRYASTFVFAPSSQLMIYFFHVMITMMIFSFFRSRYADMPYIPVILRNMSKIIVRSSIKVRRSKRMPNKDMRGE
jgi:hypothetical protein